MSQSESTKIELCPHCNHDIDDHYTSPRGIIRCGFLHTEGGETTGIRMPYFHAKRCSCRDYVVICDCCHESIKQESIRVFGRGAVIFHEHCGKQEKSSGGYFDNY